MIEKAIIKWYYQEKPTDSGGQIQQQKTKGPPGGRFLMIGLNT
jgi:hypothetical protein